MMQRNRKTTDQKRTYANNGNEDYYRVVRVNIYHLVKKDFFSCKIRTLNEIETHLMDIILQFWEKKLQRVNNTEPRIWMAQLGCIIFQNFMKTSWREILTDKYNKEYDLREHVVCITRYIKIVETPEQIHTWTKMNLPFVLMD